MRKYKVELWQAVNGEWYWHVVSAKNGKILCTSEGYQRRAAALRTAQRMVESIKGTPITWVKF